METIEIKDINGVVLFVHTAENNSVEITIEEAVKKNVSLFGANLKGANLKCAELRYANLEGANLEGANLKGANFYLADLEGANLKGANLKGANLTGAKFKGANLEGADLEDANLKCACFFDTFLLNAKFKDNNFELVSFRGTRDAPHVPLSCPSEGAFIGWKKVDMKYLVKLRIPEDARRCSAAAKKCRCDKAIVLDITSLDEEIHFDEVVNYKYKETTYKVGEIVYPDFFDEDRWNQCSHGIHFFVDKKDAIEY